MPRKVPKSRNAAVKAWKNLVASLRNPAVPPSLPSRPKVKSRRKVIESKVLHVPLRSSAAKRKNKDARKPYKRTRAQKMTSIPMPM
jgi:hypothetical protein